jgi:hypothetical protein
MPDHDPLADELLQAYLDDEVTEAERARVESALAADPVLAARAADIRALKDRLAALPSAPADADRDAQIARALAAAVVDLDAARHSRRRPVVVGAAAVAAALLLLAAVVGLVREDGSDELADPSAVSGGSEASTVAVENAGDPESGVVSADAADLEPGEERIEADAEAALDTAGAAAEGAPPSTDFAPPPPSLTAAVADLPTGAEGLASLDPDCRERVLDAVGTVDRSGTVVVEGAEVVAAVGPQVVVTVGERCLLTSYLVP